MPKRLKRSYVSITLNCDVNGCTAAPSPMVGPNGYNDPVWPPTGLFFFFDGSAGVRREGDAPEVARLHKLNP